MAQITSTFLRQDCPWAHGSMTRVARTDPHNKLININNKLNYNNFNKNITSV